MADAPWHHWGIVVHHCNDSAKRVSEESGLRQDLAGVAHWGRNETGVILGRLRHRIERDLRILWCFVPKGPA